MGVALCTNGGGILNILDKLVYISRRFLGFCLDRIFVIAIWWVILRTMELVFNVHITVTRMWQPLSSLLDGSSPLLLDFILGLVLGLPIIEWMLLLAIYVLLTMMRNGSTPGMACVRITARTLGSTHVGFSRLVIRHIGMYLSALPLGLGFFWALWDSRGRTWHDILSGTIVVASYDISAQSESIQQDSGPKM